MSSKKTKGGVEIIQLGNSKGYLFTPHPPCNVYDCCKCPFLEYPFCKYDGGSE